MWILLVLNKKNRGLQILVWLSDKRQRLALDKLVNHERAGEAFNYVKAKAQVQAVNMPGQLLKGNPELVLTEPE